MSILSLVAIYFVVWWLCLFVVLPFRVHNQSDAGEWVTGTERGAPVILRLWPKLLIATVLAAIVTALLFWLLGNPVLREYWR
jgi:predicted secreted protein